MKGGREEGKKERSKGRKGKNGRSNLKGFHRVEQHACDTIAGLNTKLRTEGRGQAQ
jgi:hypothetical protein